VQPWSRLLSNFLTAPPEPKFQRLKADIALTQAALDGSGACRGIEEAASISQLQNFPANLDCKLCCRLKIAPTPARRLGVSPDTHLGGISKRRGLFPELEQAKSSVKKSLAKTWGVVLPRVRLNTDLREFGGQKAADLLCGGRCHHTRMALS
jgi:hypothetical protein